MIPYLNCLNLLLIRRGWPWNLVVIILIVILIILLLLAEHNMIGIMRFLWLG